MEFFPEIFLMVTLFITGTAGCSSSYSGPTGVLSSPGYPSKYPDDSDCTYTITGRAGNRIVLTFIAFDLEQTVLCDFDYLEVGEGCLLESPTIVQKLCGNTPPRPIISACSSMKLKFNTDGSITKTGFQAVYRIFEGDCLNLTSPGNGSLSSTSTEHGTVITVSCNTSFTLVGERSVICMFGNWSGLIGTCEADCSVLRAPIHGSLSSSSVGHGTYLTVLCDANYSLVGGRILQCVSGSWSETIGTCEADCPTLEAPTHGSLSSSSVGHGTYMNVSCDTNYTLVGKAILLCVSGTWSETVGTCEEDCLWLRSPSFGSLSSSLVGHGTYVTVSCDTNYTLVGKSILQCVSGSWSETVGTCEEDCPGLDAPIHGSLSTSAVGHETYVTVTCDMNYTHIGKCILQCVSGLWSETVGNCEADCPELRAPIHGSLSSSLKAHGTHVILLCDTRYTLVGKSILQCVSGSWSETVGHCEADSLATSKNDKQTTTIIIGATSCGLVLTLVGVIIAQIIYFKRKPKPDRRTVFEGLDEMQMTPADTGNTYSDLSTTVKEQRQDNERPAFSGGLTAVSNEVYMQEQDTQNNFDDYRNHNMSDKKPRDAKLTAESPGGAEAGANEMEAQATYENFGFNTRGQEDYETMDSLGNDGTHLDMDQEEGYTNLPFQ